MTTIHCSDCGQEYAAKRKNVKFCPTCRLYRDLLYLKISTTKCWACDARFAPTKRGQIACADCGAHEHRRGHCAICKHDDRPMLTDDLAVCTHCAFDPKRRQLLVRAVAEKRRKLMPHTDSGPATLPSSQPTKESP